MAQVFIRVTEGNNQHHRAEDDVGTQLPYDVKTWLLDNGARNEEISCGNGRKKDSKTVTEVYVMIFAI